MPMTMTMTAKFSTIATMISRSIQTMRGKMKIHKGNWVEDVSLTMTLQTSES